MTVSDGARAQSSAEAAGRAANALLIVNGGGAVALLALIGTLVGQDQGPLRDQFLVTALRCLFLMGVGALSACLAHVFLVVLVSSEDFDGRLIRISRQIGIWRVLLVVSAAFAIGSFFWAVWTLSEVVT